MNEDLEYIKNFSKISIKSICEKENINRANLLMGTCKDNKAKSKKVRKHIESEIAKLYLIENEKEKGE